MCAVVVWRFIVRHFVACRSTRGSPAGKIWITCSICACTAAISGSTTRGTCITFRPKPSVKVFASVKTSSVGSTSIARWNTGEPKSTCCRSSRNRCCRTQGLSWSRASRAALSARRGCVASGAPMAPGIVARQERPRARRLDMPKPTVRSISASSRCGLRS